MLAFFVFTKICCAPTPPFDVFCPLHPAPPTDNRCVLEQSRLKQFALQMVCDFAHASSVVRGLMWDEGVLDFYLSVMGSPKETRWHVTIFRSLCAW